MRDHFLGNAVEDIERVEGNGEAVEHAFFEFVASDCLAVTAAGAAEVIDWQALLSVCAAIAILAGDRVGAAALGALQHAAQQIFRPVCRVEPVALPEVE
ncbi:hypothetical protein BA725_00015 [Agrobacterium pusense]|nr:hypothetical protein [Rhizobium sp. ERR1071]OJH60978.1 hypothetical protein BA725_00015 [Agrobacterium pusense]